MEKSFVIKNNSNSFDLAFTFNGADQPNIRPMSQSSPLSLNQTNNIQLCYPDQTPWLYFTVTIDERTDTATITIDADRSKGWICDIILTPSDQKINSCTYTGASSQRHTFKIPVTEIGILIVGTTDGTLSL